MKGWLTVVMSAVMSAGNCAGAGWKMLGPYGGRCDIVRVIGGEPPAVLAGSRNGMVHVSWDGGGTWLPTESTIPHVEVLHDLAVDGANRRQWYAGIEADLPQFSGIWRTDDAGGHWTLLPATAGLAVWSLVLVRDRMFAGTSNGVYRSTDNGVTWTRISPVENADLRAAVSLAADVADPDFLLVGTTHLPWRTLDGGRTWHSAHAGMIDDSDVFSLVLDEQSRAVVYASACSGAYRSGNRGLTWQRLPTPRGTFRTYVVAMHPTLDGVVFAATNAGVLRSADSGRTWQTVSNERVRSIAIDGARAIYFAAESDGILVSTDGGVTLRATNRGITNRNWTALARGGARLYATSAGETGGGLFRSSDGGASWQRLGGIELTGGEPIVALAATDAQPLLAATRSRAWRSSDGSQWQPLGARWGSPPLAFGPVGKPEHVVAVMGAQVLRLTAAGTWEKRPLPGNGKAAAALVRHGLVAVASGGGWHLSGDSGVTWRECTVPAGAPALYDMVPLPDSGWMAATSIGVLQAADDCVGWTPVREGIAARTAFRLGRDTPGVLAAAQDGGLPTSQDGGRSWRMHLSSAHVGAPIELLPGTGLEAVWYGLFPRRGVAVWTGPASPQLQDAN